MWVTPQWRMRCRISFLAFHILLFPQCCQMVSVATVCVSGALFMDILLNTLMLFFVHNWDISHIAWSKDAVANYHEDVVDLILVLVLRLLVVVFLTWFAIRKDPTQATQDLGAYSPVSSEDPEDPTLQDREAKEQRKRSEIRKNVAMAILFLIITTMSCYTGARCCECMSCWGGTLARSL